MNSHFRPTIQNGKVIRRSAVAPRNQRARLPQVSFNTTLPDLGDIGAWSHQGLAFFGLDDHKLEVVAEPRAEKTARARVILPLLGCGLLLAGGFMFSLKDRFATHAYVKEEVKLKSQFDQAQSEKRFLQASLQKAAGLGEVSRAARESNEVHAGQLDKRLTPAKPVSAKEESKPER